MYYIEFSMLMLKKIVITILCLAYLVGCGSNPTNATYAPAKNANPRLLVDQYLIGVDDEILVSVWRNPDLTITVPVRPDGRISVPLIGEVVAGGKAPEVVATEITSRLSNFIRDPQVSVVLVGLNSHEFLSRVRVSGAVRNPISRPYRQGMTVLDLVLEAGGLNEFASGNSARLYRQQETGVETFQINLNDMLNDGKMQTNYAVEPGDILTIPERLF